MKINDPKDAREGDVLVLDGIRLKMNHACEWAIGDFLRLLPEQAIELLSLGATIEHPDPPMECEGMIIAADEKGLYPHITIEDGKRWEGKRVKVVEIKE